MYIFINILLILFIVVGFLGVYVVGHILDTTHSWAAVFTQTSVICFLGIFIYILFGSAKKIA